MSEQALTVFETALGPCGIAWGRRGVIAVQLPEADAAKTQARLRRRFPGAEPQAPPPEIARVIVDIVALMQGEARDFGYVALDLANAPDFNRRVWDIARKIPSGQTLSYGEIAAQLGDKLLARDVGAALGQNPCPVIVPCHRVLAANGKAGGFSANGGVDTKLKMLSIERAQPGGPTLFDDLPLARKRR
jgi:methylated-DNA-[protein]-cysteine S-methyltransferase